jgi:hypothetical protein
MSVKKLGMILAAVCATALIVPVAAGAQTPTPTAGIPTTSFARVPVSGTAHNGKKFTGHFDVTQFVTRAGKTYALGTLTGKLGDRRVNKSDVAIPAAVAQSTGIASPAATCPVLHLDLGPLNLNLLGLTVHLNQVVLDINAVSGAGNLLGNLLCSVANLLNSSPLAAQQQSGLLNIVQQVLDVPGLLTL